MAQKWRAVSINNKFIVWFSGVTMLATVIYSIFAGWQLHEIHSGAKDTHDLAVAARKQAEAAALSLEIQERPLVGPFGQVVLTEPPAFRFFRPKEDPKITTTSVSLRLQGEFVVKNFGSSPAFAENSWVNIELPFSDTVTRPPANRILCPDEETNQGHGEVLFPGSAIKSGFDIQYGHNLLTKDFNEVRRVWILGCLSYQDGRKTLHHMRFWLRSTYPPAAQWRIIENGRYMPITGFESWGEEAD